MVGFSIWSLGAYRTHSRHDRIIRGYKKMGGELRQNPAYEKNNDQYFSA